MAEDTEISWADHTHNPWEGCQKVGPGCDHCYAEARNERWSGGVNWGPDAPRRRISEHTRNLPLRWNKQHAEFFAKHGRRQRVFCASLADVFDNHSSIDPSWRTDLWDLIEATPNLDWMLLTKRIGNAMNMLPLRWLREPRPHVWLGATVVNPEELRRDGGKLLSTPAVVHFLSMEPLLAPVGGLLSPYLGLSRRPWGMCNGISWVIVGAESGPAARPLDSKWVLDLVAECMRARVPVHVKQLGKITLDGMMFKHHKGGDSSEWLSPFNVRQFPEVK